MTKQPGAPAPILIELRCGCGAQLLIDCSPEWQSELGMLVRLAEGWTTAHKTRHENSPCDSSSKNARKDPTDE